MILRTCGLNILKDRIEYAVVEWEDNHPIIISNGTIYNKKIGFNLFKITKNIVKSFKVDFTAVNVGVYNSKENIDYIRNFKNIAIIKGMHQVDIFNDILRKSVLKRIDKETIPYYLVSFKVARHNLVEYNRVDIPVNDIMSICYMAKEIKGTI